MNGARPISIPLSRWESANKTVMLEERGLRRCLANGDRKSSFGSLGLRGCRPPNVQGTQQCPKM